jgi:hypothetical protein
MAPILCMSKHQNEIIFTMIRYLLEIDLGRVVKLQYWNQCFRAANLHTNKICKARTIVENAI